MGTQATATATVIAIKDNKEYTTPITTDGYVSFSAINFLALAKYDKEVLYKLIVKNAVHSLKIYQLGASLPMDDNYSDLLNSPIIKKFPKGQGEFFIDNAERKVKNAFSPLGVFTVNFGALLENSRVTIYDNSYSKENKTVTEANMRTCIIDFDEKMLKIYGENIGAERAIIYFDELERLNKDLVVNYLMGSIAADNYNKDLFTKEEYLLHAIKKMKKTYSLTFNLLKASHINKENFNSVYIHSLKIWNHAYTQDTILKELGLVEEAKKYEKRKDGIIKKGEIKNKIINEATKESA